MISTCTCQDYKQVDSELNCHIFLVGSSKSRPPTLTEMEKRPSTFREDLTGQDHHQGKVNNEHEEENQAAVV